MWLCSNVIAVLIPIFFALILAPYLFQGLHVIFPFRLSKSLWHGAHSCLSSHFHRHPGTFPPSLHIPSILAHSLAFYHSIQQGHTGLDLMAIPMLSDHNFASLTIRVTYFGRV